MTDTVKQNTVDERLNDLDTALVKAAFGGEYTSKRMTEHMNPDGEVSSDKIIEQRAVPPNGVLLERLINQRIGGPEDWC